MRGENRFTVTQPHQRNIPVFFHFLHHFFHCTCILHYAQAILLCMDLSVMIWCDIPLTERPSGVKRGESKPDVKDNQIILFSLTCFDYECYCDQEWTQGI